MSGHGESITSNKTAMFPWSWISSTATPGNLRAFVQATLRSIRTGKASDRALRSSTEKNRTGVPMMTTKMEFSYKDGADFVFTNPENYETVTLAAELVGDAKRIIWWKKRAGDGGVRRGEEP